MIDALITFGSIVGAFAILDVLADRKHLTKVSKFIFGFHGITLRGFEKSSIRAILSWFIRDDRLLWKRVLAWSILLSPLITYFFFFTLSQLLSGLASAGTNEELGKNFPPVKFYQVSQVVTLGEISSFFLAMGILGVLTSLTDFWNFWITKKIYWNSKQRSFAPMFLLDLTGSLLPIALLYLLATSDLFVEILDIGFSLMGAVGEELTLVLVLGPYAAMLSVLALFFIRVTVFGVGFLARFVLKLTHLNQRTVLISRAHEAPFTFIGCLVALVILGASL